MNRDPLRNVDSTSDDRIFEIEVLMMSFMWDDYIRGLENVNGFL